VMHPVARQTRCDTAPRTLPLLPWRSLESKSFSQWIHTPNLCTRKSLPPPTIAAASSASGDFNNNKKRETLKEEATTSNHEVYDKLIAIFEQKRPEDWRRMIAGSKQWPTLEKGLLQRITNLANEAEEIGDIDRRVDLLKLNRKLGKVAEEMNLHSILIEDFRKAPSRDWEAMVMSKRAKLNTDFFEYLEMRVRAVPEGQGAEREALAALATQILAILEATDRISEDDRVMEVANEKFAELLESVEQNGSIEAADQLIDDMAAAGKIDPALLLTMAKAYNSVKETDYTKEEVKDVMAHLYFKAKQSFAQQAPPEARILKHLLSFESQADRSVALEQSFTPGPEFTTEEEDYLNTTPPLLLNTIENVLNVYNKGSSSSGGVKVSDGGDGGAGGMASEAAAMMNPEVITRLRELQEEIRRKYM